LTGEQGHTNDKTNGQRVSRHSLPYPSCFIFFPTAQKILKFYADPQTAHLALPHPQADPSAKPKEPFLTNTQTTITELKTVNWTTIN
jgi:hypothetical protein